MNINSECKKLYILRMIIRVLVYIYNIYILHLGLMGIIKLQNFLIIVMLQDNTNIVK